MTWEPMFLCSADVHKPLSSHMCNYYLVAAYALRRSNCLVSALSLQQISPRFQPNLGIHAHHSAFKHPASEPPHGGDPPKTALPTLSLLSKTAPSRPSLPKSPPSQGRPLQAAKIDDTKFRAFLSAEFFAVIFHSTKFWISRFCMTTPLRGGPPVYFYVKYTLGTPALIKPFKGVAMILFKCMCFLSFLPSHLSSPSDCLLHLLAFSRTKSGHMGVSCN